MPELPEVEHLRRTLAPMLTGRRVASVRLVRPDILRSEGITRRNRADALLRGCVVRSLRRHGKQLAIIADTGRVMLVHLGMTGRLYCVDAGRRASPADHVHCAWQLMDESGAPAGRLLFRDPRRFGGLWAIASQRALCERWAALGPDALTIRTHELRMRLERTQRAVKAALLDQQVLAGVGNIYADESLFRARIHPLTPANVLRPDEVTRLARSIRTILAAAIRSGGSTIRDYIDANGEAGWFSFNHAAYGRGGEPCIACGRSLRSMQVAQRTTVHCPTCQPERVVHKLVTGVCGT